MVLLPAALIPTLNLLRSVTHTMQPILRGYLRKLTLVIYACCIFVNFRRSTSLSTAATTMQSAKCWKIIVLAMSGCGDHATQCVACPPMQNLSLPLPCMGKSIGVLELSRQSRVLSSLLTFPDRVRRCLQRMRGSAAHSSHNTV